MTDTSFQWLFTAQEPWTRYRALADLRALPADDPALIAARSDLLASPEVRALVASVAAWPGYALRRHNDAGHPLHVLGVLADFGLRADDAGLAAGVDAILAHQSAEGAFQVCVNISRSFGGAGTDAWARMACDAPVLLHALLALGLGGDPRVLRALEHLLSQAEENGWRCAVAPELGKFRGPGRKADPCPIATLYALRALALAPAWADCAAARAGIEMLLLHWEQRTERKPYLFGMGTDFRKLKYPFVWYDILHVVDVLSRFERARRDLRFREMVDAITTQAGPDGRYTAGSMYQAWKGRSFADKKNPSPWLTFLVARIMQRQKV